MRATVEPRDKGFALMLGAHELGVVKLDCDARLHMYVINDALDVAFLEGQKYLERMVERQRLELEIQNEISKATVWSSMQMIKQEQTSGPQCTKCGAFTTQARVDSHGMCMKCETENKAQSPERNGLLET